MIAVPFFDGEPFESVLKDLPSRVGSDAEIAKKVLDWSYGKLSPEEQRFLENASVFYGQVPMEALLSINDGEDRHILAKLVRKNMIEFSRESELYSLHPMLREYAYGKLGDRKDEIQIKAASEIAPRMVGGFWREAVRLYEFGVKSAGRIGNEKLVAGLLHGLGDMYHRIGDYDKSKKCHEDCLAIAEKLEDQSLEADALHSLGMIEYSKGNYDEAKKLYDQSLAIKKKLGDQSGMAATLGQLGRLAERKT